MAPSSIKSIKLAHIKKKAEEELKKGNYRHAADKYTEAIILLLPPVTAASPPLAFPVPAAVAVPSCSLDQPNQDYVLNLSTPALHGTKPAELLNNSNSSSPLSVASPSEQQHLQLQHGAQVLYVPAAVAADLRLLLANRSLAYLRAGRAIEAEADAAAAVALAPNWPKAHWRRGKSLAALGRWNNALDSFMRSWLLLEAGSAEQSECEQQLLLAVNRLTRQQLADRLLDALAVETAEALQHQLQLQLPQDAHVRSCTSMAGTADTFSNNSHGISISASNNSLAGPRLSQLTAGAEANMETPTPTVAVTTATVSSSTSDLLSQCHPEELREGMFQVVKAAQKQQQHQQISLSSKHPGQYQALLLKWLALQAARKDKSSTSSSSSISSSSCSKGWQGCLLGGSSSAARLVAVELQLLTARLAVRLKRWSAAQAAAAAAEQILRSLVVPDEQHLMQLLLDCYITLGDASFAAGASSTTTTTTTTISSSSNSATTASTATANACQPATAALAYLTALDLLPTSHISSNNSSQLHDPTSAHDSLPNRGTPDPNSSVSSATATTSNRSNSSASDATNGCKGAAAVPVAFSLQRLLLSLPNHHHHHHQQPQQHVHSRAAHQLRSELQSKLEAALALLSDAKQAAVWARAAAGAGAAVPLNMETTAAAGDAHDADAGDMALIIASSRISSSSSSSGSNGAGCGASHGGRRLALLQLGLPANLESQQQQHQRASKPVEARDSQGAIRSTAGPARVGREEAIQQAHQQLLMMTVTINRTQQHNCSHQASPATNGPVHNVVIFNSSKAVCVFSSSSSSYRRGAAKVPGSGSSSRANGILAGNARVLLLTSLARAAGVGRLSVSLAKVQLLQDAAGTTTVQPAATEAGVGAATAALAEAAPAIQSFTFKVQFGADAAAAAAFLAVCSSMASLAAACPELAAALLDCTAAARAEGASSGLESASAAGKPPVDPAAAADMVAELYTVADVRVNDLLHQSHTTMDARNAVVAAGQQQEQEQPCDDSTAAEAAAVLGSEDAESSQQLPEQHPSAGPGGLLQTLPASIDQATAAVCGAQQALPSAADQHQATPAAAVAAALPPAAAESGASATPNTSRQQDFPSIPALDSNRPAGADDNHSTNSVSSCPDDINDAAAAGSAPLAAEPVVPATAATTAAAAAAADLQDAEVQEVPAAAVIPLPYCHYRLVTEDGRPLERPDKHPFALSRVMYDPRDLPASSAEVWYEASEGGYRWRQTASLILLQLLDLPAHITSAKQLSVSIEPYTLRVQDKGSGELILEGQLCRGIVPEDSTWELVRPQLGGVRPQLGGGSSATTAAEQLASGIGRAGDGACSTDAGATAATSVLAALAAAAPHVCSSGMQVGAAFGDLVGTIAGGGRSSSRGCHLMFELTKMNLELYERPWQHSTSWWPRLFADDASDIAWDDACKDYSDLPPPIAAAAAANAAKEERERRQQEERRAERQKLQALVDRHKTYRAERLRELKAAAWARL